MKKKKKAALPKVRRTWAIHPKTRVKPSAKIYKRSEIRKKPAWVSAVGWFGEK